jgi:hypothetical protein
LQLRREAKRVLLELPIAVQEDLWDLFEQIAHEPHSPDAAPSSVSHDVHELVYVEGTQVLHVYFILVIDDDHRIVFLPLIEHVVES